MSGWAALSAWALLDFASLGRLLTGEDGNPWKDTIAISLRGPAAASTQITVALWETGLLELGERTEAGPRRWSLTALGTQAHVQMADGVLPGDPGIGGPYR